MTIVATAAAESRYQELLDRFSAVFARIAEGSREREQRRILPFEQVQWLKEAGFTTLRVPESHGGSPISHEHLFRLLIELAAADSNVAHLLRSHFSFVETISLQPAEFQDRWFPKVLEGQIFGNAATERGGNALGTTNTKLVKKAGGWVLHGEKYYTTGSIFADWIVVMATTEGIEGRQYAIVDRNAEGVEILDDWDGFGQPLTGTGTAIFSEVLVAPENIIQRKVASTLEPAFFQLCLLSVLVGIGKAARNEAASIVATRTRTFNTGSGSLFKDDPQIQELVGRLAANVFAAESIVTMAARELDAAVDQQLGLDPEAAYLRAELAVQQAHVATPKLILDATSELFDVTGASAVSTSKSLDRFWRNARTVATHNPVAFKARSVGDYFINGTVPTGLNSIGEAKAGK
ncbi:acyl-CoA dehydrogenase family protein [Glutamicibacter halophytocola]|uniref:Dibenzothiophene monooxygenase n=1 Tax=Glutamicibacter halophytocola TaxID=1933880 RepID=A0A5B8I2T7_9MICC|nr:acyl-CoA dehydrogenase family protein [Glutamicibacter halophytocola]NQD40922.1 acyl-CoA dehydrogenase [Glutamicibacter halophytocola]QDY67189.1 acyl-CoA dehydrogenase [Glutamicibacter halophytocola]UUX59359.1 acyl-CoA dehydrogenase family protein [Glutamicibacter halophytocola]